MTIHLVLVELAEAARSPRVDLVGADPDLGAQAELAAVVESGAGVDHDGRAVDQVGEAPGGLQVAGNNGVGVPGPMSSDMSNCIIDRFDNGDREDLVEELGVPVGGRGRRHGGHDRPSRRVAAQLDSFFDEGLGGPRQELRGHGLVHEQCLGRIADRRALCLGIER